MPHSQLLPAKNVIWSDFLKRSQDWGGGDVGGRGEGGEITDLIDFLTKDGGGK